VWLRSKVRDDVGATTSNTPDEETRFDDAQLHWWSVDLMDADTIEGVKGAKGNGKEPAPPGILNKEEREGVKNAWEKLIRWSRISLAYVERFHSNPSCRGVQCRMALFMFQPIIPQSRGFHQLPESSKMDKYVKGCRVSGLTPFLHIHVSSQTSVIWRTSPLSF
jgi:hypothetical protein